MASLLPAKATLINGTFNGTITGGSITESGGLFIYRPAGTPVSAIFSYDTAYLSAPDASGNRQDSFFDPSFYFRLLVNGAPFADWFNGAVPGTDPISQFTVNAHGSPVVGRGTGEWDVSIGPDSIGLYLPPTDTLAAMINGSFSIPDSTATSWLLGTTCLGLAVARRFTRKSQPRNGAS